jgi:hypothetical protein
MGPVDPVLVCDHRRLHWNGSQFNRFDCPNFARQGRVAAGGNQERVERELKRAA